MHPIDGVQIPPSVNDQCLHWPFSPHSLTLHTDLVDNSEMELLREQLKKGNTYISK